MTMVIVVGQVSCSYVERVHCRRLRFPDCRYKSLDVRLSSSLSTFKRQLKTELFSRSFLDVAM